MKLFLLYLAAILILLLTSFNLSQIGREQKVLGTETEKQTVEEIIYWQDFQNQNPNYLPGWKELYDLTGNEIFLQKIKEINPNFSELRP